MWDATLILGVEGLGSGNSVFGLLVLLLNIVAQAFFAVRLGICGDACAAKV